ncbi:MAG TPA: replication-relaxation family protein [Solirubrobacteraceae bacterium]|nr:replication-relaxation family protein [Solirubrobacteraceae bacterium]
MAAATWTACLLVVCSVATIALVLVRTYVRRRRRYRRVRVLPYRGDDPRLEQVVHSLDALHRSLQRRWWRRLLCGQPSIALEVHCDRRAWLGLTFPEGLESQVQAALRDAYPSCRLVAAPAVLGAAPYVLRVKKHPPFTRRAKRLDRFEHERSPTVNGLITTIASCCQPAFLQLALTPAPSLFESHAKRAYKRHENHLTRARKLRLPPLDPSLVEQAELVGGLEVQHRPLFFADIRIVAPRRAVCERIAAQLRAGGAENRLVERGTGIRHGCFGLYSGRVLRGEGNPVPAFRKGVLATAELACIWHMPSLDYATVPFERSSVPVAPAPPAIMRTSTAAGTLRDCFGPVSIHPGMRRQNTAVPGTVEQGKSSYLVATVAEDLRRERCAVIVFDPKGDAADAAVGIVPEQRTCTLLDFAHPTCGFDPLAVDAPADTIADYVVGALKNLFDQGDIKASSDRYLRNAIIAVLAYDRTSSLWDAARLLSVGEDGYAYRSKVAARLRTQPELKEISEFFAGELAAQLADARGSTTAKLDAPVNKLARLLNSPSIKRVLLNGSLRIDFDRIIERCEVLVVKGALGSMGAGNTSVLMQLLVGMLDASLARRQDGRASGEPVAVALKIDEAPLVINRGFAETMALKRSAGLETVACWQTDSQWLDRDLRSQLDALFAHRVYFATASVEDARNAATLLMASFSDVVRPDLGKLAALGRPDVRLHLPRHHAIASWVTPGGRQAAFVAQTLPMAVDRERLAHHVRQQSRRGGRYLEDLSQPHWQQVAADALAKTPKGPAAPAGESRVSVREPRASVRSEGAYRELADLTDSHSVRWSKPVLEPKALEPEPLDLEVLGLLDSMRHLLSSQLHRRLSPDRAATTTQRRLKRLADAGLVLRFQFHRRDGGGTPMCYSLSPAGRELCARHRDAATSPQVGEEGQPPTERQSRGWSEQSSLEQALHDVRAAAWAFALEGALGAGPLAISGPLRSAIVPPSRATPEGRRMLALADLSLPGGRIAHDFLRSVSERERVEVERFQSVRPDLTVSNGKARELLVELDDRLPRGERAAKIERYDHFLTGWSAQLARYGSRPLPRVVFVCRDGARARACARAADSVITAARAYAGEYPAGWQHVGRELILFAAERDVYEASLRAWRVPALPPEVRAQAGGAGEREPLLRACEIALEA